MWFIALNLQLLSIPQHRQRLYFAHSRQLQNSTEFRNQNTASRAKQNFHPGSSIGFRCIKLPRSNYGRNKIYHSRTLLYWLSHNCSLSHRTQIRRQIWIPEIFVGTRTTHHLLSAIKPREFENCCQTNAFKLMPFASR
ncbi:hypothetical protein CEXT_184961 [Caerostris extrusa]|uniref:Uncharacterized protein n=1 Tax=Caerostris extrusa TaxID=172846 RepID=A0AAV4TD03_CAEEX|nr:hypothetical protein CEXT_184961 [Caerostris extrusa]